jgi:hypothetical protein
LAGTLKQGAETRSGEEEWLPFLNAYRTICIAPEPDFRRVLNDIRDLRFAA